MKNGGKRKPITNRGGERFTQRGPDRFPGGSVQHGLLFGDADLDVDVPHGAVVQLTHKHTGHLVSGCHGNRLKTRRSNITRFS